MATVEGVIQSEIGRYATSLGWVFRLLKWRCRRNAPDAFFAKDGRIILIEFKATGKDARTTQAKEIQELRDAGVEVYVINNLRDGYAIFDEV